MKKIIFFTIGFINFTHAVEVTNLSQNEQVSQVNKVKQITVVNNKVQRQLQQSSTKQLLKLACWKEAETRYGVPTKLLHSIAKVETGFKPSAVGKNTNGSYDIGLMQINSSWLPKLSKYNINETSLYDPCTNIMVGAWIMSDNIKRLGYNWNAIGAYNAVTLSKRGKYAKKVQQAIVELGYN